MKLLVNRFQASGIDVRVDLRGSDIGVAQHFLDETKIDPT
jgi:hypothetical protein